MLKKRKAKEKSRSALLSVKELAQIKSDVMGEMRDLVKEETSADKALLKAGMKRKADPGMGGSSKKVRDIVSSQDCRQGSSRHP